MPSRESPDMEFKSRRQLIGYTTTPLIKVRADVDKVFPEIHVNNQLTYNNSHYPSIVSCCLPGTSLRRVAKVI